MEEVKYILKDLVLESGVVDLILLYKNVFEDKVKIDKDITHSMKFWVQRGGYMRRINGEWVHSQVDMKLCNRFRKYIRDILKSEINSADDYYYVHERHVKFMKNRVFVFTIKDKTRFFVVGEGFSFIRELLEIPSRQVRDGVIHLNYIDLDLKNKGPYNSFVNVPDLLQKPLDPDFQPCIDMRIR